MKTKYCYKCRKHKPLSEFHKDCTKKSGYHSTCRECVKKYKKSYQQTQNCKDKRKVRDKNKRLKFPQRIKARSALNYAVESGKLMRPNELICKCGVQAKEYHHLDYISQNGLNVIPVCIPCHRKIHSDILNFNLT